MYDVLNKKVLAEVVAENYDLTKKDSLGLVDLVFDEVIGALSEGKKVEIAGFGKFEVKTRAARKGINPATKEQIMIPASNAATFKAAKALKESIQ